MHRSAAFGLLALWLLGTPVPSRAAEGQVLDRLVATVNGQVITLSMLEFETRVALVSHGGTRAAWEPISRDALFATLGYLVGQKLVYQEAAKLSVFEVDQADVDRAVRDFADRLGSTGALDAFLAESEIPQGELRTLLRRDLRVSRYLDSQVRLEARITDVQVDAYVAQHPDELGARPVEAVREEVRGKLLRDRYAQLAQAELRRLRARAKVRIIDPEFAGADAPLLAPPREASKNPADVE